MLSFTFRSLMIYFELSFQHNVRDGHVLNFYVERRVIPALLVKKDYAFTADLH